MCVHSMTRPSPAYANKLNRSPATFCSSTRYPSDERRSDKKSPTLASVPVTEGIPISVFVNSNGFMPAAICSFQRCDHALSRKLPFVAEEPDDAIPIGSREMNLVIVRHLGLQKDLADLPHRWTQR